jgi:uncharacterized protein YkwD
LSTTATKATIPETNHRENIMSRPASAIVLLLVMGATSLGQEKKDQLKLTEEEQAVIDSTNAERKKANLKPLAANALLMKAARLHAANMAKQDKLDHVLDKKNPADRVKDTGYRYFATGENIAWNPATPADAVKGWMDSPPHKENILNNKYTEIGVALAKNEKGEIYWVQVFGTPRK